MALGTTSITTTLVGNTLGVASRDVGVLCSSSLINKWSKNKPVRYNTLSPITEAQLKEVNYGLDIKQYTAAELNNNTIYSWNYLRPRGGNYNEYYRLGDFRGYNHQSTEPLKFEFPNEAKEYTYNTIMGSANMPIIKVRYRLSGSLYSAGMSGADISLSELNIDGVSTGTIGNYLPCVTNGNYVANSDDTLNLKFGTNIENMVIDLNKYNIYNAFVDNANDTTHYPEGATEKKRLILYAKINKFTPSAVGAVRNNNNTPSTAINLNGYYTTQDYPFISVDDTTPLIIYKYKKIPIKVSYSYLSITNGATTLVPMFPFIFTSAPYSQSGVQTIGGKTINFSTQGVNIDMQMTVYNIETSPITIKPHTYQGTIFPQSSAVTMLVNDVITDKVTIAANGSANVVIRINYAAGVSSNYTFPSFTSPAYGVEKISVNWKCQTSDGYGESFVPTQYNGDKELRWR